MQQSNDTAHYPHNLRARRFKRSHTVMLKHIRFLSFLLGSSCLVAATANANTADLAVLSDQSAKITASQQWKCSSNISVNIDTADATFFEVRVNDLGQLFGAALDQLISSCPSLNHVSIYGRTNSVEVIKGQSKKSDNWVLRLDQSRLTKDALSIPKLIKTFDDLANMLEIFSPYRAVQGIDKTSGYMLFAQNSQTAVRNLLADPSKFDKFIEVTTLENNEDVRRERISTALSVVQLYEPQVAQNMS